MSIIKIKTIISVSALAFIFLIPALSRASEYDFYVDKNSSVATEDGSEQYPFKTIGAALSHIQSEGLKSEKIFVKTGTYTESINLVNNTKIIGESEGETIINAAGFRNGVNFVKTKSEIKNITIKSANSTNIIIDKKSKATIKNCTIKKAGSFGIEVEKSSTKDRYKFTIKNSKISENDSKGFHISKRKILISGNEVFDNGEEGIDLHSGQKGTVSGNDIRGNDESGIEAILSSGVKLTLKPEEK